MISMSKTRLYKCKVCKEPYQKQSPWQVACKIECALVVAKKIIKTARVKDDKERKEKLKTKSDYIIPAQNSVNAFIRERDKGLPCISCDTLNGQMQAGHYLSRGARPNLRFVEDNIHGQCARCNGQLAGNAINYRIRLVKRIGLARVEALECDHEPRRYKMEDYKLIIADYKIKLKALKTSPS